MRETQDYIEMARSVCLQLGREKPLPMLLGFAALIAGLDENTEAALALMLAVQEIIELDPRDQAQDLARRIKGPLEHIRREHLGETA